MTQQSETSNADLEERLKKPTTQNQRKMNLQLALNQANEELREAHAQRRIADTKTYATLSATLVFVGFLVSLRPWMFVGSVGLVFFAFALGLYCTVVEVSVLSYFPRKVTVTNTRAIIQDLNRPNDVLTEWVVDSLLEFADANYRDASKKGFWVKVEIMLLLGATLLFGVSVLVG